MGRMQYAAKLHSDRWLETRERIIHRAKGHCEECGDLTKHFNVHHTKYIGTHPSDTPDEYLQALCRQCHDRPHWHERLAKYSAHKRQLYEQGIELTPELQEELIRKYEV